MESGGEDHMADRVNPHCEHPTRHQHRKVAQTRCGETMLESYSVNLERLRQIPSGHRRSSSPVFVAINNRDARNVFLFQELSLQ